MLHIDDIQAHGLAKPLTTAEFPFDEDTLVFKVAGKMFAALSLSAWERGEGTINLKCDPDRAVELRAEHPEVLPGFHMNKRHWNTVEVQGGDLPDATIRAWMDDSYALVVAGLPKRLRAQVEG